MGSFEFMVLYVDDLAVSKAFYTKLLGRSPRELSPTFVSFELESGLKLELCQRDSRIFPADLRPQAPVLGGGTELCLTTSDAAELNRLCGQWKTWGARIVQEPTPLVFGLSFVAADPDGHRLRVSVAT
jgi:predicted lactoylglutathione lyase